MYVESTEDTHGGLNVGEGFAIGLSVILLAMLIGGLLLCLRKCLHERGGTEVRRGRGSSELCLPRDSLHQHRDRQDTDQDDIRDN